MKTYQTKDIRNIALIAHGGAGKTTLTEAMVYTSGAVNRLGKVDAGTSISDFDTDEIKRKMSINTTLAPVEWNNVKVNILDTPGYFDFVGEVQAALRVVDAAVVVVCAASGIEVGTEKAWEYADEYGLPRVIVFNKLDRENVNFADTLESAREQFGLGVIPVHIPIGKEEDFKGVVDLVKMKALIFSEDGLQVKEEEIPDDMASTVESFREMMMESVAEADDELLMKYLDGEALSDEEINTGLRKGVLEGKLVPVLCAAFSINIGSQPLLDFVKDCLPSPVDVGEVKGKTPDGEETTRKYSVDESTSAMVYKTLADPYVGRINFFKVFSGKITSDSQVFNASKDETERFGQIFLMRGKTQISVQEAVAGDIAAVAKLAKTSTGDSLCDKGNPIIFEPITFPKPVISYAVSAKSKGDEEKVFAGLTRFLDEDPTLQVEKKTETKQTLLWGMGELHLGIVCNRLTQKFGVEVELDTPKVPYKETIRTSTKVEGKHKKQSGGRGQYGHVWLELIPLTDGSEFEFEDKIFGGAVPKQYVPAVEKGVREAMEEGVLANNPVTGIKVIIYDGSYHTVDSSEMAFKIAASMAFKKGMDQAQPVLLEPIMEVEIIVPEVYMGDIMGDINAKRGRILGTEPSEGKQIIKGQIPLAEMFRYSIDLRSMTQGRGFFDMEFNRYEEVPDHIAKKIIEASQKVEE